MAANLILVAVLLTVSVTVYGAHFEGGTFHWNPIILRDGSLGANVTYDIAFYHFGRNEGITPDHEQCSRGPGDAELETPGDLTCMGCKNLVEEPMTWFCDELNMDGKWAIGGRTFQIQPADAGSNPVLMFNHRAWIGPLQNTPDPYYSYQGWRMFTEIVLGEVRSDTGRRNRSPITSPRPVRKYHKNCNYQLEIHVDEPDNDPYRCRYTKASLDECYEKHPLDSSSYKGDLCGEIPYVDVLENCTLFFNTHGPPGHYAVRVAIEDLDPRSKAPKPLSKISLSFLMIVDSDASTCDFPIIISPDWKCKAVTVGETFTMTIVAQATSERAEIDHIEVYAPGMTIGEMQDGPGALQKSTSVVFEPTAAGSFQVGFSAVDEQGFSSDWTYVTVKVVESYEVLAPQGQSSYPREGSELDADEWNSQEWRVTFNRQILRPSQSAYITILDDSGDVVQRFDTSDTNQVTFKKNSIRFATSDLSAVPQGRKTYTLRVDEGAAVDMDLGNCGGRSAAGQWNFDIVGTAVEPNTPKPPSPPEQPGTRPPDEGCRPHNCKPARIPTPGTDDGAKCYIHPKHQELTVLNGEVEVMLCCEGVCRAY